MERDDGLTDREREDRLKKQDNALSDSCSLVTHLLPRRHRQGSWLVLVLVGSSLMRCGIYWLKKQIHSTE